MDSIYRIEGILVDILAGHSIDEAARDAVGLAQKLDTKVAFQFNGVLLVTTKNADPRHIVKSFHEQIGRANR